MPALGRQRWIALGTLATGVVCPCHVLAGLAGLAMGGQVLSAAAQDGLHAVYVPIAIMTGALLLRRDPVRRRGIPPSKKVVSSF